MSKTSFINEGKMPPQTIELEEAVLGAIILDSSCMLDVVDIIDENFFYKESNKIIYHQAVLPLYNERKAMDMMIIINRLKEGGNLERIGGPYYISSVCNRVVNSDRIKEHAYIVKQSAIARELIKFASNVIKDAYDESVSSLDLLNQSGVALNKIGMSVSVSDSKMIGEVIAEKYAETEKLCQSDQELTGNPTGFHELDRITGGWQPTDFIVVAARPGMGKTTIVLNMLENSAVQYDRTVAIFSLEMEKKQLAARCMSSSCNVPLEHINRGKMTSKDWERLNHGLSPIQNANIIIDDQSAISLQQLNTKVRRLKHEYPDLEAVYIDYIGLMSGEKGVKGNRESEISTISRGLKQLAKDLNIAVIALCQLSRGVETRGGDKRPMLSDLRDSGAIEQDADVVMFVYRPEYYNIMEDESGLDLRGKAYLTIAKHRNGSLGEVMVNFTKEIVKFTNLNDDTFQMPIEGSKEFWDDEFSANPDDEF